ncbi:MAG: alkaline phosphatase D family protein [Proteobacteria bacterium]|nr:alkaline phosphatase D family protein [Pseudomonadota bacterium]
MTADKKFSGFNRREFAAAAAAMGASLAFSARAAHASKRAWKERRDLYPQGVASGDPDSGSVILWTRCPPATGNTAPKLTVEVAEDDAFRKVVATAAALPLADNDWTVRVLAAGLKPATTYWYRFTDAHGMGSRIGRTRTAPADDDSRPVNFAFVSCQDQNTGYNNAYRRMLYDDRNKPEAEQLGFVLHLGDFFYELVWYPEDRTKPYYNRKIRDVVRYPTGQKIADYHIPVDLADYRAAYKGYLADPDLADARANWPFICMWDNHEFSWRGFQGLTIDTKDIVGAQTRKVAATQAWFEYQPARVAKAGDPDWNRYDAPKVADADIKAFDVYSLVQEPNNLAAINALRTYRHLKWGKNVDLLLTDNRSFRSYFVLNDDGTNGMETPKFLDLVPQEIVEILDAGKAYGGGHPPDTIAFGDKQFPNFRKDKDPQSILGKEQKAWFLEQLRASKATWKIWGNSQGSLNARLDMKNLPAEFGTWPGKDYGMFWLDDWAGFRHEQGEILDFVKDNGITGLTSVCGDRHASLAGLLSKSLPPQAYEPVALEFVGTSISSPGTVEVYEVIVHDKEPLHALLMRRPPGAPSEPMVNFSILHGVKASLTYDKTGDLKQALAQSNPEVAPHLAFVDLGAHGYSAVRASADRLETTFVSIPNPAERSTTDDGGPVTYRIRFRANIWQPGETPKLEQEVVEGVVPFPV